MARRAVLLTDDAVAIELILERAHRTQIRVTERSNGGSAREPSLLSGLIFDDGGERMTPKRTRLRRIPC